MLVLLTVSTKILITLCITTRDEHKALFDYNTVHSRFTEKQCTLDVNFYFCGKCIVMLEPSLFDEDFHTSPEKNVHEG